MRYSVSIGYNKFVFFDGKEALAFVRLAVGHMESEDDVIITVTKEEEKEENSNGMDV